METVTTLVEYEVKSGSSKKGPWSFYLFKDNTGTSYQTAFGSDALGSEVTNYLNQPARISYEIVTRGDFQNNVIQAIQSANGASPTVPTADVPAPQPVNTANGADRELKIHRQTAAKVAVQFLAFLDEDEEKSLDTFYIIADALVDYFQNGQPAETVAA